MFVVKICVYEDFEFNATFFFKQSASHWIENSLPCSDTETKVAYNNSVTMKDSNKISSKREEIFLSFNLGFQLYFN